MDKSKLMEMMVGSYNKGYHDGQENLKQALLEVIDSHKDDDPKQMVAGIVLICSSEL